MATVHTNEFDGKHVIYIEQGMDTNSLLTLAEIFKECKENLGMLQNYYFYEGHAKMLIDFEKSTLKINLIPESKEWGKPIEKLPELDETR